MLDDVMMCHNNVRVMDRMWSPSGAEHCRCVIGLDCSAVHRFGASVVVRRDPQPLDSTVLSPADRPRSCLNVSGSG